MDARLGELVIISRVVVISTVSGGSIVGALYYLHVKKLLESKPDCAIAPADYVAEHARHNGKVDFGLES